MNGLKKMIMSVLSGFTVMKFQNAAFSGPFFFFFMLYLAFVV